ncbi:magnesium transporter [Sporosarcina sp. ACRSL]|uniref:magnesium transporter n=1 Tax=Sporosarcina sp. ACRSL TaxID=2918215 RepID=UPI001EF56EF8|nr:magnesium transporter [Sporosarcina sp. ACRSL]MCG7343503.1 magnesium transporter [Sporosarcina sp. ACRSL]
MTLNGDKEEVLRGIVHVLKEGQKDTFQKIIGELTPYETASYYRSLPRKRRILFLEWLSMEQLVSLLKHLTRNEQLRVLQKIGHVRSTELLGVLKSDDLAYLLSDLPSKEVERLIAQMKDEEKKSIRKKMKYPKRSAGRAMISQYVWVHESYTVEKTINKLKNFKEFADYLNYVYVIDDQKRLSGVASYRDLLLSEPTEEITDVMTTDIVKVHETTKQSDVAKMIGQHDFLSMPVVNDDDILVGIITADDVLDIVMREANEDIEMLLASGKEIDFHTKPITAAFKRLPWLVLLLFIGLVSGSIISKFEATLEAVVALAFFMPMIAGMTGNTGTQSLAVVVRGLVTEELTMKKTLRLIFRELLVGITLGIICGAIISVIAYIWQDSFTLGLVVGASLVITLIIGTLAGTIIPLVLNKFKVDPAIASGPLITTINDILSLLIYFGIATMFISKLM